jgi:general secretion pathway protein L
MSAKPGVAATREGVVGKALRWWLGQLAAMAAPALERRRSGPVAFAERGAITVRRRGDRSAAALDARPLAAQGATVDDHGGRLRRRMRPARLRLGEDWLIRRRLRLPSPAAGRLAEALRFQVELETPLRIEDAVVGGRVVAREGRQAIVELVVARRSAVARLSAELAAMGWRVEGVEFADADGRTAIAAFEDASARRRDGGDRVALALLALCVGLAAAAAVRPWWALGDEIARLEARIEALRPDAARAEAAFAALRGAEARMAALARLRGSPLAVESAAAVARALPDDAWLESLEIEGSTIRMTGYAVSAARLPAALETDPALFDARLLDPVTAVQGADLERFRIGVRMEGAP